MTMGGGAENIQNWMTSFMDNPKANKSLVCNLHPKVCFICSTLLPTSWGIYLWAMSNYWSDKLPSFWNDHTSSMIKPDLVTSLKNPLQSIQIIKLLLPSKLDTIKLTNLRRWWTERYRASSARSSGLRTTLATFSADVFGFFDFFSRSSKSAGSGSFGPSCWRLVKNSGSFATTNLNGVISRDKVMLSVGPANIFC